MLAERSVNDISSNLPSPSILVFRGAKNKSDRMVTRIIAQAPSAFASRRVSYVDLWANKANKKIVKKLHYFCGKRF